MHLVPDVLGLDLTKIPVYHGFYSLGIIKKFRPDIEIVPMRLARPDHYGPTDHNPWLLIDVIQQHLKNQKIVFIIATDDAIMGDHNRYDFASVVNEFVDEPVYFVTRMDAEQSLYWRFQKQVKCKILELPWILTNDAICYQHVNKHGVGAVVNDKKHNFLCMINRGMDHKYDLLAKILDLGLAQYGLITYRDHHAPEFVKQNFVFNEDGPVLTGLPDFRVPMPTVNRVESGQIMMRDILVSSNVANFIQIENTYDIPLIINPETTVGIFPATEKSLWPVLLGKMYLIYGHQHCMQWIDRFCSYGPANFCDVSFDNLIGYDKDDHARRLEEMLIKNQYLIKHAREIYQDHEKALQENRWDFIRNLCDFFRQQVNNLVTL